jgi:hypothetical protein
MKQKLETIVKMIISPHEGNEALSGINIQDQFIQKEEDIFAISRNLNASFLIALAGISHPLYGEATEYLNDFRSHPFWRKIVSFYQDGIEFIRTEISNRCYSDDIFERDVTQLYLWLINPERKKNKKETIKKVYKVFFPEGVSLSDIRRRDEKVALLREKRKIKITKLNSSPIRNPAQEILFTSNILITVPSVLQDIEGLSVSPSLQQMLKQVVLEEQMYWYDHPIPVGVDPAHNEILYGLEGLDRAITFEKERGNVERDTTITCVLSVSVTHEGLQGIAKEYLEEALKKEKNIQHLDVYIFTEADTVKFIKDILIPAAERYSCQGDHSLLHAVIGVDGEYGRHYSFLKAIAAFWQVFINAHIRGTFKIDLDQVFPQKELVEQSGSSALEHLMTPLWGAEGVDNEGKKVELGMIAGALVNKKDCGDSLFTPDIRFPVKEIKGDSLIFFSTLPQALSTEAEMMTRYTDRQYDGKEQCIQRIHVTGGTCGILTDSLRRYRPFTPSFIGRAEDQAYILSVLFQNAGKNLRYLHKDGLIMRHDKEDFAGEAIQSSAMGKLIGDYIRILMFSYYVHSLPWSFDDIKDTIDPFTGCFVSKIPLTVIYLRFALKAASFFSENTKEKNSEGFEFLKAGITRLHGIILKVHEETGPLTRQFHNEMHGWNFYYDILDALEKNIADGDPFAHELQKRAKALVNACKINLTNV